MRGVQCLCRDFSAVKQPAEPGQCPLFCQVVQDAIKEGHKSPPFAPVVSVQFSTACFAFCSLLLPPFKLLHGLLRSAVPPKTLPAVRSLSGAQGQQQLHSELCIEVPVNSCCAHSSQPCSRGTQGLPEPSFGRWVQLSPLQCTENAPSCRYKAAVGPDPTSLQGASNKAELQA